MEELGRRARAVAPLLAATPTDRKNRALLAAADGLQSHAEGLLEANEGDLAAAKEAGISATLLDRLRLTPARIDGMAGGLRQVADLPDPVGTVVASDVRPNGLRIEQVRVPLGVVAIVYESRPNVTSDAAGLCLKSGNVAFLRGSSMAIRSNLAIAEVLRRSYEACDVPADALILVEDTSREAAVEFMRLSDYVDCLIPRGGPALIRSIMENATVPFILDGDGNCHVYVDRTADLDMAEAIVVNGKTQRPSVCNATESIVLHAEVAAEVLPRLVRAMPTVEMVGDETSRALAPSVGEADEADYGTEFLDYKLSVRVVDSLDAAIDHVNHYGTRHSEVIVTADEDSARRFCAEVDAACVLVNASSRFVDGEEMGYGAEIGISTQKLHVRGPMGLVHLTAVKNVIRGDGQIRP
ncbi:MAG: glutamate-5-semialdehyde dehydrogenase [Acidimicrobiia bacterium]|nr:glutamate-5-semialdehyde dehydrogenase [Acidimicrobiia bacterium]MYC45516.1 glutamate-5-semialdehyde dehydrogenase [Acidimicrobiia bacterium]MYI19418.1 glutamate-5-semialdehyde dehydrogenase [Acidimicrobiia bacterium]